MNQSRDYDALRRQSLPWVRQAGRIAVERFGKAVTSRKADDSPVTDADHAVQAALLQSIASRYPRATGRGITLEPCRSTACRWL